MHGTQIRLDSIPSNRLNLSNPILTKDPITKGFALGNVIYYTDISTFRNKLKVELSDKINVSDYLYKYDASDTTSIDDGVTILKSADGKVYKRVFGVMDPTILALKVDKTTTVNGKSLAANIVLNKADVGLGNVNDVPDASKPVSTLQKALIDKKVPFGTIAELKANTDVNITTFQITDAGRFGLFILDSADTTSTNDDALVIINIIGGTSRRFKRQFTELRPEYWGGKADGTTDNYFAIQSCLDYSRTHEGAYIVLSAGIYLVSQPLAFKYKIGTDTGPAPQYTMKTTIVGAGKEATTILGTGTFVGNILEMNSGLQNFVGRENWVTMVDFAIEANNADRCFYANYFAGLSMDRMRFKGGEICCVQLGSSVAGQLTLNYSVYMNECVCIGVTTNKPGIILPGNSEGNIIAHSVLFLYISSMEGDGGRYGIYMNNCSDSTITGCKIEGYKKAVIWIEGTSGAGNHKIVNNYFGAYGGFDPNHKFDGVMYGIYIGGTFPFSNTIANNNLRIAAPVVSQMQNIYSITSSVWSSIGFASASGHTITGNISGATGWVQATSQGEGKIWVQVTSSIFQIGETFSHRNPQNAVIANAGTITAVITPVTYGVYLDGGYGNNNVSGNMFANQSTYGIYAKSKANSISNNGVSGETGIYTNTFNTIISNTIYSVNGAQVAINNDGGNATVLGNHREAGSMVGSTENYFKRDVGFNNIVQNSGSSTLIYNTANQTADYERAYQRWNGNIYTIGTENIGAGQGRAIQIAGGLTSLTLNSAGAVKGVITTGASTSLTTEVLQIFSNFTSPSLIQKILTLVPTITQSGTGGFTGLFISAYLATVGSGTKLLIDVGTSTAALGATHTSFFNITSAGVINFASVPLVGGVSMKAAASADTATAASGTYSQTQVQGIITELRDLKTKMKAANLLTV